MKGISSKLQRLCFHSCQSLACLTKSILFLVTCLYRVVLVRAHPLWIQIAYFLCLSFFGFWVLKAIKPRVPSGNLDLFFTSVSASTVSSMSTLEMENFSNPQLIVMTFLMFVGGEVFTSTLGLFFIRLKLRALGDKVAASASSNTAAFANNAALASADHPHPIHNTSITIDPFGVEMDAKSEPETQTKNMRATLEVSEYLRYSSLKYLGSVVLGYQLVVQAIGVVMVSLYISSVSSAKEVLKKKGLEMHTFSVFTVVSTFASCGFVPTNENMVVFGKHWGLLMMLIPQVLLGNTLFPACLRMAIWAVGKLEKRKESEYLLERTEEVGYKHLLPRRHSACLVATVLGFIMAQVVLFGGLDWNSEALKGLGSFQKLIGITFQSVNSRHTGETIVDLSVISPAVLVLFVVMMYLPPYTSWVGVKEEGDEKSPEIGRRKRRGRVVEKVVMSQLSYLVMFMVMVCVTEREQMRGDPVNFSVGNMVVEVISAYGNVGFTTGYSCHRRLKPDAECHDTMTGLVGRWSPQGKIILLLVMLFGRLKKFNMNGGKAWILF